MKPFIGVTAMAEDNLTVLKHDYANSILQSGGIPLTIPFKCSDTDIGQILKAMDGLLLTGGPDVDPDYYGEEPLPALDKISPERDRLEIALTVQAIQQNKPIFAICRGMQVLNVAMGGSLYQDIHTQHGSPLLQHRQKAPRDHLSHQVSVVEQSLLHRIAGRARFKVNSFHHQAVKKAAPGFQVAATASDGIIEAIESSEHLFVLGVQWHPEDTAAVDTVSRRLFDRFVEVCSRNK